MTLRKKILTMVIAVTTVFALSVTALAADNDDNSITKRERFQHLVAQRQLCVQAGCLSIEEIKTLFAQKVEDGKLSAEKAAAILERIEARRAACDGQANTQSKDQDNAQVKAQTKAKANDQANCQANTQTKVQANGQANDQGNGDCNGQANCQSTAQTNAQAKGQANCQANNQANDTCTNGACTNGVCDGDCNSDCDSECNSQCNTQGNSLQGCGGNGSCFYDLNNNIDNSLDNVQCLFKTQIIDCSQAK